tara:strand:- start:8313 stop:8549 length:237 start_codon:yes stop_codon:yes gene_type:complete
MKTDIKTRQADIAAQAGTINTEALEALDGLITQLSETTLLMVAASPDQHRVCELARNLSNNARHLFDHQIKPLVKQAD